MKHIFYFLTIIPILWELRVISEPARVNDFIKRYKETKGTKFEDRSANQKAFLFFSLFYTFWVFTGFLSSQWPLFILLFALGRITKTNVVVRFLDGAVSLIILMFIVLNAYHLNIDLGSYLVNAIKGLLS